MDPRRPRFSCRTRPPRRACRDPLTPPPACHTPPPPRRCPPPPSCYRAASTNCDSAERRRPLLYIFTLFSPPPQCPAPLGGTGTHKFVAKRLNRRLVGVYSLSQPGVEGFTPGVRFMWRSESQRRLNRQRELLRKKKSELLSDLCRPWEECRLEQRVAEDGQAVAVQDGFASQQATNLIYERIRSIEVALDLMAQGRYGECVGCGSAIPSNRLDALPWAIHCSACEEGRERKRQRSADLSPAVRLRIA